MAADYVLSMNSCPADCSSGQAGGPAVILRDCFGCLFVGVGTLSSFELELDKVKEVL